jgi:hypothetical protein
MKHDEKAQDKFIDDMIKFIKDIDDEIRVEFAVIVAFHAALYLGYNHVESIGILECAKTDLQRSWDDCVCNDCKEKEEAILKVDKKLN